MSSTIRVAEVSELPPGKGRVVEVGGRHFTVFNRDGRFYATTSHNVRRAPPGGGEDTSTTCPQHGMEFDVWMEDSPARLNDEERCGVEIDDDVVWLVLD
jgi:nitrite reductase/ring-hydroxylating ferredoxin subunit